MTISRSKCKRCHGTKIGFVAVEEKYNAAPCFQCKGLGWEAVHVSDTQEDIPQTPKTGGDV